MDTNFTIHGYTVKLFQDEMAPEPENSPSNGVWRCDFSEIPEGEQFKFFAFEDHSYSETRLRLVSKCREDAAIDGCIVVDTIQFPPNLDFQAIVKSYLDEWNMYYSGDVWGYEIWKGEHFVDSCWGFYGFEYCKQSAIELIEQTYKHNLQRNQKRLKQVIRSKVPLIFRQPANL